MASTSPLSRKRSASTVEVLEASALPTIDGADNLASDDGTEREPDSEEDVEGTLGEAPPGVTEIGIDAALEPEKVEASTVEVLEASALPTIDGADNLASDDGTEREPDSEEAREGTLGEAPPGVTEIGIDAALEPETVEASTVEASKASAPQALDGADNLASDAGTEREPDSEECAQETLSDGDSPSVTEIGLDVALESEKVEASTAEASEASALPALDGADNLASDADTEREPDSEEGSEVALWIGMPWVSLR